VVAEFGYAVGTAGDVNGDGYADVIVGAAQFNNGLHAEGRAFVYHGAGSGLSLTPNWTAESNQASALFGYAVGTAGDVNGDGFADVIVGAPYFDNGQSDEGRAFIGWRGYGLSDTGRRFAFNHERLLRPPGLARPGRLTDGYADDGEPDLDTASEVKAFATIPGTAKGRTDN
jgi:hypothetical protein